MDSFSTFEQRVTYFQSFILSGQIPLIHDGVDLVFLYKVTDGRYADTVAYTDSEGNIVELRDSDEDEPWFL